MKKKLLVLFSAVFLFGISLTNAQTTTVLHNFTNGEQPYYSLTLSNGVLYGVATYAGAAGWDQGYIFSMNTDGSSFNELWDFYDTGSNGNANGAYPYTTLTIVGHKLYGATYEGGSNDYGMVFSINTNGTGFKDLWDFADTGSYAFNSNGAYPENTLTVVGNKLYGTTTSGGANNYGTIYSVDTNGGNFKDLWDFADTGSISGNYSGKGIYTDLAVSGKTLYGFCYQGGANNQGLLFSIDTSGHNYKDRLDFSEYVNGEFPEGSVTVSADGKKLFGTADEGGAYNDGVVFTIDTAGHNYKTIYNFNYVNGEGPEGKLALSGNTFYGTTYEGGLWDAGTVFTLDTTGGPATTVATFNFSNGSYPYAGPVISGGTLYGMTGSGGPDNTGLIYSVDVCPLLTATANNTPVDSTCDGSSTLTPTGGPSPYNYQWSTGETGDSIAGKCAGNYTCTITDANGCTTVQQVTIGVATGVASITNNAEVKVYPNPSNGTFTVQSSIAGGKSAIEVYNVMGQQVYTQPLNTSVNSINMGTQANGVYMYRIITLNGSLINEGRLVIQK